MQYKSNIVYSNHLAGNCQSSECVKTQLSSIKEVGLDGDTCSNITKPGQEKCNQPEGLIHVPSMAYMATHNKINFAIAVLQCTRSSSVGINEYIIASIITSQPTGA